MLQLLLPPMSTKHIVVAKSVTNTLNGKFQEQKTETVNIVRQIDSEPPFVKCYMRDISVLHKIQRQTETVMWELLALMDYNNEISLSAGKKREICRRLDYYRTDPVKGIIPATNLIDQHIHRLVASKLLARTDIGVYVANPHIFGKGKWGHIQSIRLQIDYTPGKRIIKSELSKSTKTKDDV